MNWILSLKSVAFRLRFLIVPIALFLSGCHSPSPETPDYSRTQDGLPIIPVTLAPHTPVLNGFFDSVWQQTQPVTLQATRASDGKTVRLRVRALRTDQFLFLAIRWPDSTESLNRLWVFRDHVWQTRLQLNLIKQVWEGGRPAEDGLLVLLPDADAETEFRKRGITMCKPVIEDGNADEPELEYIGRGMLDVWYWQAQRTNPVDQALDASLLPNIPGPIPDSGSGGCSRNGQYHPVFRDSRTLQRDRRILKREFAEPLTEAQQQGIGMEEDSFIPRDIVERFTDSAGDVTANGNWSRHDERGGWLIMLKRSLRTDSGDDVQFTDFSRDYPVVFAVMDNAGLDAMYSTEPAVLRFTNP